MARPRLSPVALAGGLFVVLRVGLFAAAPMMSDVDVYARFAWEYERARAMGRNFYDFHDEISRANYAPLVADPALLRPYGQIEYPELAVQFMRLPSLFTPPAVDTPADVEAYLRAYNRAFRLLLLACDVALFAVVVRLARLGWPADDHRAVFSRLLNYTVLSTACGMFLYERFDLALALLTAVAVWLLVSGRRAASLAGLALAVGFKFSPAILGPLWVVAASPATAAAAWRDGRRRPLLVAAGMRFAILAALCAAVFALFYLIDGPRSLEFIAYHRDRRIEIGSVIGSVTMLLGRFGWETRVYHGYGCVNIGSAADGVLLAAATYGTSLALLVATVLTCRRLLRTTPADADSVVTANPAEVIRGVLLLFVVFVAGNKVFSPQYLLWLLPFAVAVPAQGVRGQVTRAVFLATCLLTGVLYYRYFWTDVTGLLTRPPEHDWTFAGPTPLGAALLGVRNLGVLALIPLVATLPVGRPAGD